VKGRKKPRDQKNETKRNKHEPLKENKRVPLNELHASKLGGWDPQVNRSGKRRTRKKKGKTGKEKTKWVGGKRNRERNHIKKKKGLWLSSGKKHHTKVRIGKVPSARVQNGELTEKLSEKCYEPTKRVSAFMLLPSDERGKTRLQKYMGRREGQHNQGNLVKATHRKRKPESNKIEE